MTSWLIDTALFKFLAPGPPPPVRKWIEAKEDPIFLSAASLVEFEAAIAKVPSGQSQRAEELRKWLDGLVSGFADRIYPIDCDIARRAGALLSHLPGQALPDIVFTTSCWLRPPRSTAMAC